MLNLQESALVRGWAQGLPLHVLALKYFDARSAAETRREIEALRARLVDHARRHGQLELAKVLGDSARAWAGPGRAAEVLAAITRIDRLGPPVPKLTDAPAQWLPAPLAKKLVNATGERFATFDALFDGLAQGGYYWWRSIPKLGAKTAREIVRWLDAQGEAFGRVVPADVLKKPPRSRAPVRMRAALVEGADGDRGGKTLMLVPLERFCYPVALETGG